MANVMSPIGPRTPKPEPEEMAGQQKCHLQNQPNRRRSANRFAARIDGCHFTMRKPPVREPLQTAPNKHLDARGDGNHNEKSNKHGRAS